MHGKHATGRGHHAKKSPTKRAGLSINAKRQRAKGEARAASVVPRRRA